MRKTDFEENEGKFDEEEVHEKQKVKGIIKVYKRRSESAQYRWER